MTRHMRVTQHYTNIISQEQIISWRTPEDKLAQAQVNAVLTCKVCDEAFGSLKELSYHMVKNAHYKEHILRSITEGGHGRRRQTRERRKKSLPVRKLLELERMEITPDKQPDSQTAVPPPAAKKRHSADKMRESSTELALAAVTVPIPCDDCGERVAAKDVISHLKTCKAGSKLAAQPELWSPSSSASSRPGSGADPSSRSHTESPPNAKLDRDHDTETETNGSDGRGDNSPLPQSAAAAGAGSSIGSLSALESLVEKSFDKAKLAKSSAMRHMQHLSANDTTGSGSGGHERRTPDEKAADLEPVKAVLTCKVCDEAFSSLHDLSYHMRKNAHYKVHILRSVSDKKETIPDSGGHTTPGKQAASDDVPAKSLASLKHSKSNRAANDAKSKPEMTASERALAAVSVPIPCDECGEHIDAKVFIKHLKSCRGKAANTSAAAAAASANRSRSDSPPTHTGKDKGDDSDKRSRAESPTSPKSSDAAEEPEANGSGDKSPPPQQSGSGFINALENLIERSFGNKTKTKTTGILQRLGIDEEACPPWQHMAGQAFGVGLPFHPFHPWAAPGRDRRSTSPSGTSSDFGEENGSPS